MRICSWNHIKSDMENDKEKRLIESFTTVGGVLLLTAALMFSDVFHVILLNAESMRPGIRSFLLDLTRPNNWIVTLSIGAVFELYSSVPAPK